MRRVAKVVQRTLLLLIILDLLVAVLCYALATDGESKYLSLWGGIAMAVALAVPYAVCFLLILIGDVRAERKRNTG